MRKRIIAGLITLVVTAVFVITMTTDTGGYVASGMLIAFLAWLLYSVIYTILSGGRGK